MLTEIGYDGLVAVELSRHSHAAHEMVPAAMAALRAAEREVGEIVKELAAALEARARPEGLDVAARGERRRRRRRRPRSARASRWSAARSGASRSTRTPTPPTSTRGRSTTPRARCCCSRWARRAEGELAELYRYGDAAERRGVLRALPYLDLGDRGLGLIDDAIRTNDTRLIAAALGPVRHRAPVRRVVRPGRAEVRLRRRADHRRSTASPSA